MWFFIWGIFLYFLSLSFCRYGFILHKSYVGWSKQSREYNETIDLQKINKIVSVVPFLNTYFCILYLIEIIHFWSKMRKLKKIIKKMHKKLPNNLEVTKFYNELFNKNKKTVK